MNHLKRALFLDRDGIINVDFGYVHEINELQFIPGIVELIKYFNHKGYYVFVITNQSGISRGYYTAQQVEKLHKYIEQHFSSQGALIDAFYYCPHHPKGAVPKYAITCNCRKPKTGMVLQALKDYAIDIQNSLLIGDKDTDILVAQQLHMQSMLFTDDNIYEFYMKSKELFTESI